MAKTKERYLPDLPKFYIMMSSNFGPFILLGYVLILIWAQLKFTTKFGFGREDKWYYPIVMLTVPFVGFFVIPSLAFYLPALFTTVA